MSDCYVDENWVIRCAWCNRETCQGQCRAAVVPIEWQTQEELRRDYPPPQNKEGATE